MVTLVTGLVTSTTDYQLMTIAPLAKKVQLSFTWTYETADPQGNEEISPLDLDRGSVRSGPKWVDSRLWTGSDRDRTVIFAVLSDIFSNI